MSSTARKKTTTTTQAKAPAKKAPTKTSPAKKAEAAKKAAAPAAKAAAKTPAKKAASGAPAEPVTLDDVEVVGPDGKKVLPDIPDEKFEQDVKADPTIVEDEKEATFVVSDADDAGEPEQQVVQEFHLTKLPEGRRCSSRARP